MVTLFCIALVLLVTLAACRSDAATLRIPNSYSVIVLALFCIGYAFSPNDFYPLWNHALALFIVLVVTYLMFAAGMMGGGDSKFGASLALWLGVQGVAPFVFWMAVGGGVIGILSLLMKKKKPFTNPPEGSWAAAAQAGLSKIPYGIAISFGFWIALWHSGLITHELDEVRKIIH
ncbi:MAG TPA: prepilin peptidase [Patescibacteria group bacterium]|nr:prepilin peptidase [Patescibacteria group bacterium]